MTDPTFGLELDQGFIAAFKSMEDYGWTDFLDRLKMREALRIASATTEEERTKVHVRVLLIDELANFSNSLFRIDKHT